MKKNILIFKPHSIVDIITNSSSELFVCNTDKTVEFIEKFIADFSEISHTSSLCEVYQITEENIEDFVDEYIFGWYINKYDWFNCHTLINELKFKMEGFYNQTKYHGDWVEHNKTIYKQMDDYKEKWKTENMETLKKDIIGNIIIKSSNDNSIDPAIFNTLEHLFNANRFHL